MTDSEFVFYPLVDDVLSEKKSKIDVDKLLSNIVFDTKKADSILSPVEVANAIVKELQKLEEKTKDFETKFVITDVYNIQINSINEKKPVYNLILKMNKNYYPLVTPDISIYPSLDPVFTYKMFAHPDLDTRNTSRIKNIDYIINIVNSFLDKYDIDCKLNPEITNYILLLLKNNNFKMKTTEVNTNVVKIAKSGVGYGGSVSKWDVNAYLTDIIRIKTENKDILEKIYNYLVSNKDDKDINSIHEQLELKTFWIDLIEKYELTDEIYFDSIYHILYIIDHLNLKIKIPFFDDFIKLYNNEKYSKIIEYINKIKLVEEKVETSTIYIDKLKVLQSGSYPYAEKGKHNFKKEMKESGAFVKPNTAKLIMKHYSVISSSLPISNESAIFFRQDDSDLSIFKFLIIPNEDTPYKYGCFVFEAHIPPTFPNVPPEVNHSTSRKNNYRFNPNLYNCGKVCLSLLGTWNGQSASERWIPPNAEGTGSTLFQVIMSIYSMVFSEDPWFNEPGRERNIDKAEANITANNYNKDIQDATIKFAIINQLKYPEEGFEDVIKTHFELKKDKISAYLLSLDKKVEDVIFNGLLL